ncbi:MAG: hypothetical protein FWG64_04810 [Firmicutes bacterium]|nr:hypothetical protein [Bacillota bacterium]
MTILIRENPHNYAINDDFVFRLVRPLECPICKIYLHNFYLSSTISTTKPPPSTAD